MCGLSLAIPSWRVSGSCKTKRLVSIINQLNEYTKALSTEASFDSLYHLQFEDSIYQDERSLQTNRFKLGEKNPDLAEIIDSLPIGDISNPVQVDDGWYILKINNVWQNIITTESEMIKLRQESINFLTQKKMDIQSAEYVNDLILDQKINRSVFSYLRVLSPTGIYVTTGGSMGRLFQALILGPLISIFTKKKVRIVMLKPNKDLAYINELFEAGKLTPKIDKPFRLNETAAAMNYFGEGNHLGKIVISIKK